MELLWAAFLGLLQGLTEFLPVSSSGHLVLVQEFVPDFSQPGVLFDVVLHAGTLLAIVFYFRRTILKIKARYLLLLGLATIPAALVGFFFNSAIEGFFKNIKLVGLALIFTALLNFLTDRTKSRKKKASCLEAFWIGIAQALAIIPGISRSGATIFTGTTLGVEKKKAAEFSFLLSVPAVIGANLLQFFNHGIKGIDKPGFYFVGFLAAFFSGILAIDLVLKFLLAKKFRLFAFYCLILGLAILIF